MSDTKYEPKPKTTEEAAADQRARSEKAGNQPQTPPTSTPSGTGTGSDSGKGSTPAGNL